MKFSELPQLDEGVNSAIIAVSSGGTTYYITLADLMATTPAVATAVRAAALTGLSTATNAAVVATDSVLAAIGKLQAQANDALGRVEALETAMEDVLLRLEALEAS